MNRRVRRRKTKLAKAPLETWKTRYRWFTEREDWTPEQLWEALAMLMRQAEAAGHDWSEVTA